MKRFLIFRTDRIGDFIASKIILESIKNQIKIILLILFVLDTIKII